MQPIFAFLEGGVQSAGRSRLWLRTHGLAGPATWPAKLLLHSAMRHSTGHAARVGPKETVKHEPHVRPSACDAAASHADGRTCGSCFTVSFGPTRAAWPVECRMAECSKSLAGHVAGPASPCVRSHKRERPADCTPPSKKAKIGCTQPWDHRALNPTYARAHGHNQRFECPTRGYGSAQHHP